MNFDELGPRIILWLGDGSKFHLAESTCYEIILAVILAIVGIWMGSNLQKVPKGKQVLAELFVGWIYRFTEEYVGKDYAKTYAPYLGSLITWLVCANGLGVIGLRPITADINVTAALAVLSFLLIQGSALKYTGIRGRIDALGSPYYFIIPMNIISELVLPFTLALRCFGNIFGGFVVVELWLHLMEFLSFKICAIPFLRCITVIPLNLFFDMFEPVIQAYIFMVLTAVNLGEGIRGQDPEVGAKREAKRQKKRNRKLGIPDTPQADAAEESLEAAG